MEKKEDILPNAGYATHEEINTWIAGTSADTTRAGAVGATGGPSVSPTGTAILPDGSPADSPSTAPLQSATLTACEKTAVLPGKTEVLPVPAQPQPDKTEVLPVTPEPTPEEEAK